MAQSRPEADTYSKGWFTPKKVMLTVWWNMLGVVHHEVLNMNQTINADIYCQQLDRL